MGEQIVESCSYQNRLNFALGGGGEEKSRVVETCLKKLPPKHHFLLVKCLGELQAVLMIYVWRKWREVFSSGIAGSSHMQDWNSSKCCQLVCEKHFVPFQLQGGENGLVNYCIFFPYATSTRQFEGSSGTLQRQVHKDHQGVLHILHKV